MRRLEERLRLKTLLPAATVLAPCICWTAFVGCAAPEVGSGAAASVLVRDSAGIEIVENSGEPRQLDVREVRRIGSIDGAPPYLLSEVRAIAVTAHDTVFVANSRSGSVRVFEPSGQFVREFGQVGEGPSEVGGIGALWLTGDTVVLRDLRAPWKTVLFHSSGTFLESWSGTRRDGSWVFIVGHGDAGWIAEVRPRTPVAGAPGDSVGELVELRTFDPTTMSLGEHVFRPPRRPVYVTRSGQTDEALFRVFGSAFDDAGRYYRTHGPQYDIGVYAPAGRLRRKIRRTVAPRAIGPEDVDEFRRIVQGVLDTLTSYGPPGSIDDEVIQAIEVTAELPLPEAWSPIRELLVSPDQYLWVENVRHATPGTFELINLFGPAAYERSEPTTWDVFDPEGVLVGQAHLPARFQPMAVRGLQVTGVATDSLGVEYVVTLAVAIAP